MKNRIFVSFFFFIIGIFMLGYCFATQFTFGKRIDNWVWFLMIFFTLYFFLDLGKHSN